MNAETGTAITPDPGQRISALLGRAYGELQPVADRLHRLDAVLSDLGEAGGDAVERTTRKLRREIREFEPAVTMIGQVKAGKTTLVNAMIGWPDLLPADINPWTSVVTSIHLGPGRRGATDRARFRFFSEEEWAGLIKRGGRVGELAERAGAHRELEKVRRQLEEMRETSRRRLGAKFEMLLGQEHDYGFVDPELVQRYVCLGDDFEHETSAEKTQGRFADITRSADLHLGRSALPVRACVRDTPGVNDTFMVREQITLTAIRASRLCVVVLSAHQALSTVDMALIRMISNIRAREVVIFVNRVDELADPVAEIPEIADSIRATLAACGGPPDAEILFGSALWASLALRDAFEMLDPASAEALLKLAEHRIDDGIDAPTLEEVVWNLSGLPALASAISRRVADGEAREFEARIAGAARNAAAGLSAARQVADRRTRGAAVTPVPRAEVGEAFDAIARSGLHDLETRLGGLLDALDAQVTSSRRTFLSRATASLIRHLEVHGEGEVWTYDPAGLRVLARSRYLSFAAKAAKASAEVFDRVVTETLALYRGAFDLQADAFDLSPPAVPKAHPPVLLGQSIALDVQGNWWTRWWRRQRTYQAFAEEFSALIDAEIAPVLGALRSDHAEAYRDAILGALGEFLESQRGSLSDLARQTEADIARLRTRSAEETQHQDRALAAALATLDEIAPMDRRSAAE